MSITHLKILGNRKGKPKYRISVCLEAISPLVFAIIAIIYWLFETSLVVLKPLPYPAFGIFGETKLPKSIESKPTQ
jgi:hypothetical protein